VRSPTQRPLGDAELSTITHRILGRQLRAATLLPGGTYSTAYRLDLDSGERAVLKVGPPPGAQLLTYEQELAATEALVFEAAAGLPGVPAPAILGTDLAGEVVGRELVVMAYLDGRALNEVAPALPDGVHRRIRHEVGAICARLHTLTGERFGYIRGERRHDGSSWRTAFLSMVDDLVADARRIATTRPTRAEQIAAAIRTHADDLDQVAAPVLVHFDLWDGNVLIDDGRVSGIIDGERAFYGDPLAEFASLAVLRDDDVLALVLEGYRDERGTPLVIGPGEQRRLAFYRLYLHLLMLIEPVTRGYPVDDPPPYLDKLHELVDRDLALLAVPR
jgi:aminoglycoside phosphotransferase (APT) family kinase protein